MSTPLRDADLPLNERELAQIRRLFSDPFSYPPELWTWIKTKIEEDPPVLTYDSILGFGRASNNAVPALPVVDTNVDISATNTDLPSPGNKFSTVWVVNPGGGTLRSIGEPENEGARITLKGGWIGNTTLEHNLAGGGVNARPLLLHGGADLVLTDTESVDLVYVDTFWQDVARVETPAISMQQGIWTTPSMTAATLYSQAIAFPVPFPAPPLVQVTLNGWTVNEDVRVSCINVTASGFDAYAYNVPGSNTCEIAWLASLV